MTAILPIWTIKDFIDHDRDTLLRAIGLSHVVTAYVKAHTGRLSAVCGCSVAAGAGAAVQAALFSLHGVNVQDADRIIGDSTRKTIQNMGEISHEGMVQTDKTILKIMLEKQMTREKKAEK